MTELTAKAPTEQAVNFWRPHAGPQEFALMQPDNTFEILYGGARGGGKTDAGQVWIATPYQNPRYRGLVIRRNSNDLSDWLDRAQRMYRGLGGEVVGNPAVIKFPSGAKIYTGHLQDDKAYSKYLGHEYQRILIEEVTQIASEKRYKDLIASCRSTVPGLRPRVFLTTNPGGVGHIWVKARWVDAAQPNTRFLNDMDRLAIYIPAKVDDNPTLMENDPDYVKLLESYRLTDPDKYKAWRLGDWDVFEGQVFSEWQPYRDGKPYHVIDRLPFSVSEFAQLDKFTTFDWGFNDPAATYWIAKAPENEFGVKHLYVYREIYTNGKIAEWWADEVAAIMKDEPLRYMVLPHDTFSRLGGSQTIESRFRAKNIPIRRTLEAATHKQKINRQAMLHDLLSESPDGTPYLQVLHTCRNLIRTLPSLPYSDTKPEEIDEKSEDHAYDSLTYGLYTITEGQSWIVNPKRPTQGVAPKTHMVDDKGQAQGLSFEVKKEWLKTKDTRDWRHR